jgi:hypothetical protein
MRQCNRRTRCGGAINPRIFEEIYVTAAKRGVHLAETETSALEVTAQNLRIEITRQSAA